MFQILTVPQILGGSKISKVGYVTPRDLFWPNFAFLVSTHRNPSLCQIWSFQLQSSREIPKMGHVTPTWPLLT